jgi:hypothetical protein
VPLQLLGTAVDCSPGIADANKVVVWMAVEEGNGCKNAANEILWLVRGLLGSGSVLKPWQVGRRYVRPDLSRYLSIETRAARSEHSMQAQPADARSQYGARVRGGCQPAWSKHSTPARCGLNATGTIKAAGTSRAAARPFRYVGRACRAWGDSREGACAFGRRPWHLQCLMLLATAASAVGLQHQQQQYLKHLS